MLFESGPNVVVDSSGYLVDRIFKECTDLEGKPLRRDVPLDQQHVKCDVQPMVIKDGKCVNPGCIADSTESFYWAHCTDPNGIKWNSMPPRRSRWSSK
jgi:hypothetical protein